MRERILLGDNIEHNSIDLTELRLLRQKEGHFV
jgi:hypothetical protein